ncbi:MAG: CRISPR system precrRNA processing endoribonuclease RAMP protein Cas6 [Deltaproteobacteria bacterium]|nr:CRISPR system precrRNA processing endoribonuclease RAMP protein Cas6 [Deltaproteobacteria bacterium]
MDLDLVRIECEIVADSSVQLIAALYNALRDFEAQFKALCCHTMQKPCTFCALQIECPYRIVFGQQLSSDAEIIRLHQKPSLPFSLYINYKDGSISPCTVGMVVIGSAVNFIEFFHTALLNLIKDSVCDVLHSVSFTLRSYSLDYQGVRHLINDQASLPERVILLSGQHILYSCVHSESVRLTLKSPLRLLCNGSIAHRFDFAMFLRSQLRRCSSLYAYYGTGKPDLDYVRLSESAQNVAVCDDNTRYTQPSWSKRLNRAGLTGTVECAGLVEPMLSLLILGSYFNAGKGATFGSGFYQIAVID